MVQHPAKSKSFASFLRGTGALALALCLTAGAYARQQQQDQQQEQSQQQAGQQQSQDPPAKPTYAPQDADKPPYSHDRPAQTAPEVRPSPPAQSVPDTLTAPAGTILLIRMNDYLSSDHSKIGDQFTAVLAQPLAVNGWAFARPAPVPRRPLQHPPHPGPTHD